jgi:hypothetical protein
MFIKSCVSCFRSAARDKWSPWIAGCTARVGFLVAPSIDRVTVRSAGWLSYPVGTRRDAISQLRRVGKMVARAALRAAYAGRPLTPGGYAILALTLGAIALVAALSVSSTGDELGRALRLSWWFS